MTDSSGLRPIKQPEPSKELAQPQSRLPSGTAPSADVEVVAQSPISAQPQTGVTAMDESTKQDFLWHVHGYINDYIRFGDTKAAFAGTVASGLLAALYGSQFRIQILQVPYREWPVASWLAVAAAVFLGFSSVLALWTVRPRLRSSQSKGFIFWGSIAAHRKLGLRPYGDVYLQVLVE